MSEAPDADAVGGITLTSNGWSESTVVEVDLREADDDDLRAIATLTDASMEWLESVRDGYTPCRKCGDLLQPGHIAEHDDPPLCHPCFYELHDDDHADAPEHVVRDAGPGEL